jgi:hypothetical protein
VRRLGRFVLLRADERWLLVRTAVLMPTIRLGLWILPFPRLMALAGQCEASPSPTSDPERIAWAVQVVARYLPKATCLVQAMTAKVLLESSGFPAILRIGVAKNIERERFEAHAWVEAHGKVITGGTELEGYSLLLIWDSRPLVERSK